jgi:hypothetical protein
MRFGLFGVGLTVSIVACCCLRVEPVHAQAATLPVRPADTAAPVPPDIMFPDAVTCNVSSPDSIDYKIIFYKSQTISFAHEPNNAAEYGTPFLRDPDKFDAAATYKWRLQLGQPGNITALILPNGWKSDNCEVGKAIKDLIADKQALKMFAPMTLDR